MAGERLPMNYPYTIFGKVSRIPWMYYLKHGRGFRAAAMGWTVYMLLVVRNMSKSMDGVDNKLYHEALRRKRDHHDAFAHVSLPVEPEY